MSESREALGDDIEDVGTDEPQIVIVREEVDPDKVPTDAEIDREREAGDVDGDADDPTPKEPKSSPEDRLKRARAENKRLRREQSDTRRILEQLQAQVTELGSAQSQQRTQAVAEQKAALQAQFANAKAVKRQAREAGDMDQEEKADEALYTIRRQWERLEEAPAPQQRQQQSRQQGAPNWAREFIEANDWFDEDANTDDPESAIVHDLSRGLTARGIPPTDARHKQMLDQRLATALPNRFGQRQQQRKPGQVVAGASRGTQGAVNKGSDWIPPIIEAQYKRDGINTADPAWRKKVLTTVNPKTGRPAGEDWKKIFGGPR